MFELQFIEYRIHKGTLQLKVSGAFRKPDFSPPSTFGLGTQCDVVDRATD